MVKGSFTKIYEEIVNNNKKVVLKEQWFLDRLVSWCFEPNQPLRIISGLKTNFNPFFSYSTHKSVNSNHYFFYKTVKISHIRNYSNSKGFIHMEI